jgi:hypothetical protein
MLVTMGNLAAASSEMGENVLLYTGVGIEASSIYAGKAFVYFTNSWSCTNFNNKGGVKPAHQP